MIYGHPTRPISDSEFIPESPLFCPRADFYSIGTSPGCNEDTLQLLRVVRDLIQIKSVMDSTKLEERQQTLLIRYGEIKSALTALISATSTNNACGIAEYECCRQAASMMMAAIDTSTPFQALDTSLIEKLMSALQKTDIGNCWGSMSGVLLWVSLIGVTAAIGKPQHRHMDSVLRRVMYELTYKSFLFEAVSLAVLNFMRIQRIVHAGRGWKESQSS